MYGHYARLAMAAQMLGSEPLVSIEERAKMNTCNMSEEEIAERDRPKSRQERRKLERETRKNQTVRLQGR